jgi:hypothetical protein
LGALLAGPLNNPAKMSESPLQELSIHWQKRQNQDCLQRKLTTVNSATNTKEIVPEATPD